MTTPLTPDHISHSAATVLEDGLRRWYDRPVRITALTEAGMDGFSTNPVSRLEITLDTFDRLPVIFKRLCPKPDSQISQEVCLYQGVLSSQGIDAPALYAAVNDEASGRHWLFLEDVGDWRLEYCETETWEAAFRWLASMHAQWFGWEPSLRSLGYLQEHDPDFYRSLAGSARRTLDQRGSSEALTEFDQLMRHGLERAIVELTGGPQTLVHGDFSCHNVMVQPGGRIRTIDWEWAAVGVPGWDVVRLLDGWGKERHRLLAAYLELVSRDGVPAFDRQAFERSLPHCRVMMKLWRIRWWARACQEPGGVDRLLSSIRRDWATAQCEVAHG